MLRHAAKAATIFDLQALAGALGRTTILTPNQRLARALQQSYAIEQVRLGRKVWEPLDALPLQSFYRRLFAECGVGAPNPCPVLLSDRESLHLWSQIIAKHSAGVLLSVTPAAKQVRSAWAIQHQWRIGTPSAGAVTEAFGEDCASYFSWARSFADLCATRRWLDDARLPDWLLNNEELLAPRLPQVIYLAGFDIVTPQLRAFTDCCQRHGVDVRALPAMEGNAGNATRYEFVDVATEAEACAAWVRAQLLAEPNARVAVIAPDLAAARARISRALIESLHPAQRAQPTVHAQPPAFNISIGESLASFGLIRDATTLLRFAFEQQLDFAEFDALMRSPFLASSSAERAANAAFASDLLAHLPPKLSLREPVFSAATAREATYSRLPRLCEQVIAGADRARTRRTPHQWCEAFLSTLDACGFLQGVKLDSNDYQLWSKFHECLAALGDFERVAPQMSAVDALTALTQILADTTFQAEGDAGASVHVLGILESVALAFDGIWVMGLSDDTWPLPARANPWLPIAWQRRAGVIEASPERSLQLDQAITAGWFRASPTLVLSHVRSDGAHGAKRPSALIRDLPLGEFNLTPLNLGVELLKQALPTEAVAEVEVPLKSADTRPLSGGANVLRDVAACPYRAFARHRLQAREAENPSSGLDAAERGNLLHRALCLVWRTLKSHESLVTQSSEGLSSVIRSGVRQAISESIGQGVRALSGRLGELEAVRLVDLLHAWLEVERVRVPFEIVSLEEAREVEVEGVRLRVRIDRLDQLSDGGYVLIDYKSGTATPASWWGDRPDEPQLPLYLATSELPIEALAFARLKRGARLGFVGVSAREGMLPEVRTADVARGAQARGHQSWHDLGEDFSRTISQLVRKYVEGDVSVDPKNNQTCAQCDLQTLCRVSSLAATVWSVEENGDE